MKQLEPNDVHVWTTDLTITPEQENEKLAVLSSDERERAMRFRFPLHKRRFIAARAGLRQILSLYLNIAPENIIFAYSEHQKPYLSTPAHSPIQFNLAHSEDIAIYAFTLHHAIGIDIEKIQDKHHLGIADRYFSAAEVAELNQLPDQEKCTGFYTLWSRKEAILKAVGKGLYIPLNSFTVSAKPIAETVLLEETRWFLQSLPIHTDFQSAVACNQMINKITYYDIFAHIEVNRGIKSPSPQTKKSLPLKKGGQEGF